MTTCYDVCVYRLATFTHVITESGKSDFKAFVRKGISDVSSMLSNTEEVLEFQSHFENSYRAEIAAVRRQSVDF